VLLWRVFPICQRQVRGLVPRVLQRRNPQRRRLLTRRLGSPGCEGGQIGVLIFYKEEYLYVSVVLVLEKKKNFFCGLWSPQPPLHGVSGDFNAEALGELGL
jgi:hypothetical protein